MPKIKPCPFCGKDARYDSEYGAITCMDSEGGCGFFFTVEGELKDSLQTWNMRPKKRKNPSKYAYRYQRYLEETRKEISFFEWLKKGYWKNPHYQYDRV